MSADLADFSLIVLHKNDFHAQFKPISKYDSGCSAESNAEGKCFRGSASLVTATDAEHDRTEHGILVNGDDQFQGTLFHTYYIGKLAGEMINKLDYEGVTGENPEPDGGPEVLREFMDAVSFLVLMSNADVSRRKYLADALQKSAIIVKGAEKLVLSGLRQRRMSLPHPIPM